MPEGTIVECSFCGKAETEVRSMVESDNVAICYNCIVQCYLLTNAEANGRLSSQDESSALNPTSQDSLDSL